VLSIQQTLSGLQFKTVVVSRNRANKFGFEAILAKNDVLPRVSLDNPGPAYISEDQAVAGDGIISINGVNTILESSSKVGVATVSMQALACVSHVLIPQCVFVSMNLSARAPSRLATFLRRPKTKFTLSFAPIYLASVLLP
jgi:hypothetical protein